ncbi:MAG: glucose-6-phosphate isomerase [Clostridiaceae bacterium]|nr:glucose-6-phosphate isomerase [Clostridiaceae bacterium]
MLQFKDHMTDAFIKPEERELMLPWLSLARESLDGKTCPGAEFTGWVDLPEAMDPALVEAILERAASIRDNFDILLVLGIGGSYLGARAVIEALSHHFPSLQSREERGGPLVLFAGQQLSSDYLQDLIQVCQGKRVALNVISKSGTTTEPAIAFRVLRQALLGHVADKDLASCVTVTTDQKRGALRQLADELDLKTFDIADDIGGRYSVLTAVGLLPIAVAGLDIEALLEGARQERLRSLSAHPGQMSPADRYAVNRLLLHRKGYSLEFLAAYEPSMRFMVEWWKQLFGESEGKDGRGIVPAGLDFTTDLHSLGQLIQDGPRILFETVIRFKETRSQILIPWDDQDRDQLNYLADSSMAHVNDRALEATALAHLAGGVPNMEICLDSRQAQDLGRLIYFFERACALSALMNAVNPFDQPGVESYKKNMFALLGKSGFEALRSMLESQMSRD